MDAEGDHMKIKKQTVTYTMHNGAAVEIENNGDGDISVYGAEFLIQDQDCGLATLEAALKDLHFLVEEVRKVVKG
jgi:hypothetical protein